MLSVTADGWVSTPTLSPFLKNCTRWSARLAGGNRAIAFYIVASAVLMASQP